MRAKNRQNEFIAAAAAVRERGKSTKIIRPLSLPSWRLIIFHFEAARTHTDRRNAHLDGLLVLLLLRRRRAATSPRMSLGPKKSMSFLLTRTSVRSGSIVC